MKDYSPALTSVTRGIIASRPASEPCDDLKGAATTPEKVNWNQYARYWHGYRLYSVPLASAFPILILKIINLVLLVGAARCSGAKRQSCSDKDRHCYSASLSSFAPSFEYGK